MSEEMTGLEQKMASLKKVGIFAPAYWRVLHVEQNCISLSYRAGLGTNPQVCLCRNCTAGLETPSILKRISTYNPHATKQVAIQSGSATLYYAVAQ